MQYLHAADIHLDSPMRGLPEYPGAPVEEIRNATRDAFHNMVDLAIERAVDFVLIVGDLYDGDWKSFDTGLVFNTQMVRLRDADIPVFVVFGNHDAASVITKRLSWPENVHVFSHRKPETVQLEDLGVAIHGQSFKTRDVFDNLATEYPKPVDGFFNIGLMHTAANGREGHAPYAPCSVNELAGFGYDYWALGHVHNREILSETPYIVFPGNLQGRHIRETAPEGKGCTLVDVDSSGRVSLTHEPVDTVRWCALEIDVSGADTLSGLMEKIRSAMVAAYEGADGRLLATRITLTGATSLHGRLLSERDDFLAEIRSLGIDVAGGEVWVEKLVIVTQPITNLEDLMMRQDILGSIAGNLNQLQSDPEFQEALSNTLAQLFEKLPADVLEQAPELLAVKEGGPGLNESIEQAAAIVVERLAAVEVPE